MINNKKISVYLTSRCAVSMNYPVEAALKSALNFCDELVILDSSDKNDGTMKLLESLASSNNKINLFHVDVPWSSPNAGIWDGQTKAMAREQCTGDLLIQQDLDEIFEDNFKEKLDNFLKRVNLTNEVPISALPVVEPWSSQGKIRMDVNPWKERISLNNPEITHGIPTPLRYYKDELLYSQQGSDGCNIIHAETGLPIPCMGFMPYNVEQIRRRGLQEEEYKNQYNFWYQTVINELPTVYHFSWWSIAGKIKKYREFWNKSWLSLYGEQETKPKDWNPFFNKSLENVTDEEIKNYAEKLALNTGGHIFHTAYIDQKVNHITIENEMPSFVKEWMEQNKE